MLTGLYHKVNKNNITILSYHAFNDVSLVVYTSIFVIAVIGRYKIFENHLPVVLCTNKEMHAAVLF
jgi:hypothetical protein